jgi:dihydroorotate dehydrogenase (NAD+) catalytic subunit
MIDLSVDLCGVRLRNPLVLASGIWGSGVGTLLRAARDGAGAVTTKSCSLDARVGHPNPTVLAWEGGLINAVGLSNPGAVAQAEILAQAKKDLSQLGVALIASVFGDTPQGFAAAVQRIAPAAPDLIELNVSCPNVESEFGRPFALDPDATAAATRAVRQVFGGPLLVKLSPNAPNLVDVGKAAVDAGADGLTAVNTLGPGMIIDVYAGCPVLSNRVGGVSGQALLPIAVRCVYELAAAVDVPIIGTGGVSRGSDAMQMIMAGASAVGLGSALYREGSTVFQRIGDELAELMEAEGYTDLSFRGCAHRAPIAGRCNDHG